jgi:hypothetical protein
MSNRDLSPPSPQPLTATVTATGADDCGRTDGLLENRSERGWLEHHPRAPARRPFLNLPALAGSTLSLDLSFR